MDGTYLRLCGVSRPAEREEAGKVAPGPKRGNKKHIQIGKKYAKNI